MKTQIGDNERRTIILPQVITESLRPFYFIKTFFAEATKGIKISHLVFELKGVPRSRLVIFVPREKLEIY